MNKRIIGRNLAELTSSETEQVAGGTDGWTWTTVSTNIGPHGDTEKQMDPRQPEG